MTLAQAGIPLGALVHPILLNNLLPSPAASADRRLSFSAVTRISAGFITVLLVLGCLLVLVPFIGISHLSQGVDGCEVVNDVMPAFCRCLVVLCINKTAHLGLGNGLVSSGDTPDHDFH